MSFLYEIIYLVSNDETFSEKYCNYVNFFFQTFCHSKQKVTKNSRSPMLQPARLVITDETFSQKFHKYSKYFALHTSALR